MSPHRDRIPPEQERSLLRRLRDLNLSARNLAVRADLSVSLSGCISLDRPVEQGVRYRLSLAPDDEQVLELAWTDSGLSIRRENGALPVEALHASFALDERGRAVSPELRARIDLSRSGPRDLEHFMRRIVRTTFQAA